MNLKDLTVKKIQDGLKNKEFSALELTVNPADLGIDTDLAPGTTRLE